MRVFSPVVGALRAVGFYIMNTRRPLWRGLGPVKNGMGCGKRRNLPTSGGKSA
jgi:hypothetical protein